MPTPHQCGTKTYLVVKQHRVGQGRSTQGTRVLQFLRPLVESSTVVRRAKFVEAACIVQRSLSGDVCPIALFAEERDFGVVEV
jgi:hypothetical protein